MRSLVANRFCLKEVYRTAIKMILLKSEVVSLGNKPREVSEMIRSNKDRI